MVQLKIVTGIEQGGKLRRVVCEQRWRPVVGLFWNLRDAQTDQWYGFRDDDELLENILTTLGIF
jgi:hypothetical protein